MVEPKALKIPPKASRELPAQAIIDGRYRVVRALGSGGTALVYEVEHVRTGRRLALKVIGDQSQGARLEQEAKATAKLKSRHAVRVVDLGVHAGSPYLVMSLLEGHSLRDLLVRRGRIDLPTAANIVLQVAECLDEAHRLNLVHRDIKPENFHLRQLGSSDDTPLFDVTVLDFGVVKMAYDDSTTQLTRTGSTVGTPFYMSLEQLRGAATVDAQSDIYSLSVLLYESFTGTVPFQAATLGDLVFAICSAPPVALHVVRPELPLSVSEVVMAGLSSSKADRPKSMRVVAEAFRPHADPSFTLWLRGDALVSGDATKTEPADDPKTVAKLDANALPFKTGTTPKPGDARIPLSDPPTAMHPGPKPPTAPRAPTPPKPPPKPGDPPRSDPRGAKAPEAPKAPPGGLSPLRATVMGGLRAPVPRAPVAAPGPIDEPSTTRDDEDPPTALARDRDTPTEMFVKDLHGNVRPPGMPPSEAMPSTEIDPAQYPTMNLDVTGVDTGEATAVIALPLTGNTPQPMAAMPQPTPSQPGSQPGSTPLGPQAGPATSTLVSPNHQGRSPSLSGVGAAPTFGTPSQSFAAAAPGAPTQGYPYAPSPYPGAPGFQGPVSGAGAPLSNAVQSGAASSGPRSIDVFMDRFGRKGNAIGANTLAKFRAASPAQQALIVGIAAALGAVILVTLVFVIFF